MCLGEGGGGGGDSHHVLHLSDLIHLVGTVTDVAVEIVLGLQERNKNHHDKLHTKNRAQHTPPPV